MRRHLARSDERQSVTLSATSFLTSSFWILRPKPSWGNVSTAARIYPFATEPSTPRFQFISQQSRTWYFGDGFGWFLANSGHFCGQGATLWCRDHLFSPNNFTLGHSLKIECLVANVYTCQVPWARERIILGMTLGVFRPVQATFVVVTTLWSGNPLWALITSLRVIQLKYVEWLIVKRPQKEHIPPPKCDSLFGAGIGGDNNQNLVLLGNF